MKTPRSRPWRDRLVLSLLLSATLSAGGEATTPSAYHTAEQVAAELQRHAAHAPEKVHLASLGKSAGGREIWVATVASPGAKAPAERPAVFVGANLAGGTAAGTEAALHLLAALVHGEGTTGSLLAEHTFYIAPLLNPDAHAQRFAPLRYRRTAADGRLDHDRDGLWAEDGFDDLDGDGRITSMRIADPLGDWLPHPEEPRLMVKADASKGWLGTHRLETEGHDNDGDGAYNEDGPGGPSPNRSFPHAFPHPDPDAGPWPSYAAETRALLDFLLARRNIALAVVYGPANNLLAIPEPLGAATDPGSLKFKVPSRFAGFLGLDPEVEYSIDEIWATAKDLPIVRQRSLTKDQLAQFLGAGPANRLQEGDQSLISDLAKLYKEKLQAAGLDNERPAAQYAGGGLTPWLYYQYGALALELDIWGIPKAKKPAGGDAEPLTLARLGGMSKDDFLKLSTEQVADFLKRIKAPPQLAAEGLIERVRGDQVTPERLAEMAKQMGAKDESGGKDDTATTRQREVLAWLDANLPSAVVPWTAVTLADGGRAEVGGLDGSLIESPPLELISAAFPVHTQTVLELAGKLARLEILTLTAESLGGGVFRVEAAAINRGDFPTHTEMAAKARAHLPVRLELVSDAKVELLSGARTHTRERLPAKAGTLAGDWLIRAQPGAKVTVRVLSEHAGSDSKSLTLPAPSARQGGSR